MLRVPYIDTLLQVKPQVWRGVESAGQAQGHVYGDGRTPVDDGGNRFAGNTYAFCKGRNAHSQWFKIKLPEDFARSRGASCSFHVPPPSGNLVPVLKEKAALLLFL